MNRIIPLWPGEAPYSAESPNQGPPVLTEYASANSRSAILVCPGGGYAHLTAHEGGPVAEMFCSAGLSAYVLRYRVRPCHFLAPLSDVQRAVRLLRSMGYGKIAVVGFSAGGHLCCCAATMYTPGDPDAEDPVERYSSRPDAFIPCYARVSYSHFPGVGSRINLLGNLADHIPTFRRFSAEEHITADTPPAFIWHTASDATVPVENAVLLGKALSAKGVPFELHIFPEGPHGLGLAAGHPRASAWTELCLAWLGRLGFTDKNSCLSKEASL